MNIEPFGDLSGRRAVVTGSSSGIGRAIAIEFARAGADVVVHHRRSESAAEQTAAEVRALGRRSQVLQADLADESQVVRFFEAAWESRQGADIWVNNAGADVLTGAGADLGFADKLDRLWEIDVRAAILLSNMAGKRMRDVHGERPRAAILNIGWDKADRGMEGASGELFAASKNAIMGYTRSLAVSLAPQVRVNCIAPGWIRTAWGETASERWQERVKAETPLERWGTPEDVAKLARFLASDDAAFLTGQVIRVNGGVVR